MPNRTFAFSHRGGFWKTRYTFYSTAYATLNKIMLGFDTILDQALTWTHNTGGNTAFYGDAAAGSGISVTFNDRPSSNKIYKSVSIEGTNNILGAGAMIVNNSTTNNQAKPSPLFAFDDKGGILYGKIQGLSQMSMSNIKPVGQIVNATDIGDNALRFEMNWFNGGQSNTSENTGYVFSTNQTFFLADPNTQFAMDEGNQSEDFNELSFIRMGGNFLDINFGNLTANANIFNGIDTITTIFSISSEDVNGDQLRGQIADAVFALGAADYELYALNLEYEATTYDHSAGRTTTAKRARRRTV